MEQTVNPQTVNPETIKSEMIESETANTKTAEKRTGTEKTAETEERSLFADGLPDWDLIPPQVVVRRRKRA